MIDRDPARAKEALTAIEGSSRDAVQELHRLLGFLRQAGDPDPRASQPGLDQLPRLAATMRSELAVDVHVEGAPRRLPATVDVSAYRIVQEALTNALKHARGSRADVHVRVRPGELEVEVRDDGTARGAPPRTGAGGLGLIGMRERAALHGGELHAGPAAGGGFAVRARLPTPESSL